jgi:hypothetical protein
MDGAVGSPTAITSGFGTKAAVVRLDAPGTNETLIERPAIGCDGDAGDPYDEEQAAAIGITARTAKKSWDEHA